MTGAERRAKEKKIRKPSLFHIQSITHRRAPVAASAAVSSWLWRLALKSGRRHGASSRMAVLQRDALSSLLTTCIIMYLCVLFRLRRGAAGLGGWGEGRCGGGVVWGRVGWGWVWWWGGVGWGGWSTKSPSVQLWIFEKMSQLDDLYFRRRVLRSTSRVLPMLYFHFWYNIDIFSLGY